MEEDTEIIEEFLNKLLDGMEDSPSEYSKVIDEHFWELS